MMKQYDFKDYIINDDIQQHSGYIDVDQNSFYYVLVNSIEQNDDLLIWFQGGPGCSFFMAYFYGCGPYHLNSQDELKNQYSWHKKINVLFVDQPVGSGFSVNPKNDYSDIDYLNNQNLQFLEKFYSKYPRFYNKKLYMTGESMGTRAITDLAYLIYQQQERFDYINITGILLISGWLDFESFNKGMITYMQKKNLLTPLQLKEAQNALQSCLYDEFKTLKQKKIKCFEIPRYVITNDAEIIRYKYNITKVCESENNCFDYSKLTKLANDKKFRQKMNILQNLKWKRCSKDVIDQTFVFDVQNKLDEKLPFLQQQNIKLYFAHGDLDLISNFDGLQIYLKKLNFQLQKYQENQKYEKYTFQNVKVWNLNYAGHMIAHDDPKTTFEILEELLEIEKISTQDK